MVQKECYVIIQLSVYICITVCFFSSFFQGTLKGFDQAVNLILDESHERVFSPDCGVQQVVLGLYIIRGDNMYVYF